MIMMKKGGENGSRFLGFHPISSDRHGFVRDCSDTNGFERIDLHVNGSGCVARLSPSPMPSGGSVLKYKIKYS